MVYCSRYDDSLHHLSSLLFDCHCVQESCVTVTVVDDTYADAERNLSLVKIFLLHSSYIHNYIYVTQHSPFGPKMRQLL